MPAWFPSVRRSRSLSRRTSRVRRFHGVTQQPSWIVEPLEVRALLSVTPIHVAETGDDGTGDGSAGNPYRTIDKAITEAALADDGDDTILVAGGTYDDAGVDEGFTIPDDANIDNLLISGGFLNNLADINDPKSFTYVFEGIEFPFAPLLQPRLGSIEEWKFLNNNNDEHPIHIHVNDFQVTHYLDPSRGIETGPEMWAVDNANVPAPNLGPEESVIQQALSICA